MAQNLRMGKEREIALAEAYHASDTTTEDFCRNRNISDQTLYRILRKHDYPTKRALLDRVRKGLNFKR